MIDLVNLLKKDDKTLDEFINTIGDAMFVVDTDHNIVFWNNRAEQLTGYSADEVLGRHCLVGIRCKQCLKSCRLFELGRIDNARIVVNAKDGREIIASKSAFVLKDKNDTVIGGVELLRDETELADQMKQCRDAREEVEARERIQSAILGSVREGVLTIDKDWRITSFSRRAEAITGHMASDAIGRFCHEVIGSTLCENDCPALYCLETGSEEAERTAEMTRRSGKRLPAIEIAVPLRDENGEALGSLLLVEDRSRLPGIADAAGESQFVGMIGSSKAMRAVFRVIEQVAPTDVTVLISGESGTGKERVARAVHQLSPRRSGPFEAVNCAALPETLLESELFGHKKGAFTGAMRDHIGRIERAESGTLFLDEVGEMQPSIQAKLLRFLQEHEYQRVGDSETRQADVRVLAASNRDLKTAVEEGLFREDLYYRLRVIPVHLPPLRERNEDIPILATNLLARIASQRNREGMVLTHPVIEVMRKYQWPGNVREMINMLEYAVALAPGRRLRVEDLPPEFTAEPRRYSAAEVSTDTEAERIKDALERHGGNKSHAARFLGMNRVTLYRKMKRFGIS